MHRIKHVRMKMIRRLFIIMKGIAYKYILDLHPKKCNTLLLPLPEINIGISYYVENLKNLHCRIYVK